MNKNVIAIIVIAALLDIVGIVGIISGFILLATGGENPALFIIGGLISMGTGIVILFKTLFKGSSLDKMMADLFGNDG